MDYQKGLKRLSSALPVAMDVAAALLKRQRRGDDGDEKVFGPRARVRVANRVSTIPRNVHSAVTSTTQGATEFLIWGKNPFPHLIYSRERNARRQREAVRDGVPYFATTRVTDFDFGSIWSAIRVNDGKGNFEWRSDGRQGTCCWYAFPTISSSDIDKAYASAWSNDASVDATHLTTIESFINRLEFRNVCNNTVEVTVYQCWPRDDVPIVKTTGDGSPGLIDSAYDILYQGSNQDALNGPDLFVAQNFNAWQPVVSGAVGVSPTAWDFTPYKHPIWRQLFKCRPYYNRKMAPGDTTIAQFGTVGTMVCDPADDLYGNNVNYPTQAAWAYKKNFGPIYLMRVRGTLVHGESSSTPVTLTNGTEVQCGEGHPNRPVVNYGNFHVDFSWKSEMYCRAVGANDQTLMSMGYYGGTFPRNTNQTWDYPHEQVAAVNDPAETAAGS